MNAWRAQEGIRGEGLETGGWLVLWVAAHWSWLVPMDTTTDTASPPTDSTGYHSNAHGSRRTN